MRALTDGYTFIKEDIMKNGSSMNEAPRQQKHVCFTCYATTLGRKLFCFAMPLSAASNGATPPPRHAAQRRGEEREEYMLLFDAAIILRDDSMAASAHADTCQQQLISIRQRHYATYMLAAAKHNTHATRIHMLMILHTRHYIVAAMNEFYYIRMPLPHTYRLPQEGYMGV